MSLGYLFSVVFDYEVKTSADFTEIPGMIAQIGAPAVLIVSGGASRSLALIAEVSRMPAPPQILALDHDCDGAFGVAAFRAGACDVVRPPFALREMAYRVQLRLGRPPEVAGLDEEKVTWDAEAFVANQARLTTAEAQIARVLIRHDSEIVSRDDLSLMIDRRPWKYGDRKFDVHVAKIRKKFHAAFGSRIEVKTVRSAGYRLTICEEGLVGQGR
ncbi:winged helix-turn-helix domain-containing protein [Shimia sp.]|uniref:winged helix-turn-helix domain-containing protein n=1 Tax=Shimia sp. TaxID=1954381 RepID=UPI00356A6398